MPSSQYAQFTDSQKRLYFEKLLGELPLHSNGQWLSRLCPLHSDLNPSASINIDTWLFNCHAGCTGGKSVDIYGFEMCLAGTDDFQEALKNIVSVVGEPGIPASPKFSAIYYYHDPQGKKAFAVCRTNFAGGDKRFKVVHKDEGGNEVWKRPAKLYPYHCDSLAGAEIVWITEGEKCADLLYSIVNSEASPTTAVTTNPFGGGKWEEEYSAYLKDKYVIVLPDNDLPGQNHAQQVALSVSKQAKSVRVLRLPGEIRPKHGDDIEQFQQIHGDGTAKKLIELVGQTPEWTVDTPLDCKPMESEAAVIESDPVDAFPETDMGNAEAFAAAASGRWLYDHSRGWYQWIGHYWKRDEQKQILNAIVEVIRSRADARWAAKQEQVTRIEACERLAHSQPSLSYDGRGWNQDPFLIAVNNGVIDLSNGAFRPGRPNDHINVHMGVDFEPSARCPKWQKFINEIMNNDADMAGFLKRSLGYSISGSVKEQVMFLCCGGGSNGKNTLVDTLKLLLGDYGRVTQFYTFLNSLNGDSATSQSALAGLCGSRFVVASEAPQNSTLSSSRLKGFIHGDPQTAKFMHKDFFEFVPQAKLWLTTNDKPKVNDSSEGFWRSIYIIPFEVTFSEANGNIDKNLKTALEEEKSGILNWLVQGFREYQEMGLKPPDKVMEATKEYQEASNPIAEFIGEGCDVGEELSIKASDFYKAYVAWAETHKIRPISNTSFGTEIGRKYKKEHTKNGNVYRGIGIRTLYSPS